MPATIYNCPASPTHTVIDPDINREHRDMIFSACCYTPETEKAIEEILADPTPSRTKWEKS